MKGYIVYVSQQIFPIVQGIAWAQQNGFSRVVLLCTPNSGERSEKPAKRIKKLCMDLQTKGIWNKFHVDDPTQTDFTPQAVTETIETLIHQTPGEWVINTTGGLKLMSFGSANFAGKLEIQYAELSQGWYRIGKGVGTALRADPWKEAPQPTITDKIPIKTLAEAQFPSDEYRIEIKDFLEPDADNISEILKDIAIDGNWERGFKKYNIPRSATLEHFFGLLFYKLGAANVSLNLKVIPKIKQGKQPMEADVVANINGRLRFMEVKFDRPELPTLLKKLASLKELSGIGGSIGLFTPLLSEVEGDEALIKAYQVTFWNEKNRADLIPQLYDFMHGRDKWKTEGSTKEGLVQLDALYRQLVDKLFIWSEPMPSRLDSELGGENWSYFRVGAMGVLLWRSLADSRKLMGAFAEAGFTLTATGQTTRKTNGQQSRGEAIPEKTAQVFICNDEDDRLRLWLDENVKGKVRQLTPEALRAALSEVATESDV
jgi:hypothetical protein